ncbi:MAG: peptidylprolyl isomerase [Pseudohongiellaceae bacterium]|nr:peptidylprolyl isomerase [Pseudohongiellaceae bacterium]
MTIEKHSVVNIHYTLKNDAGEVLDSSEGGNPLTYLHGAHGLIPGLESELDGKKVGDSFNAVVPPEQAYGEVNPELVHEVDRSMFRGVDKIEPGMVFTAQSEQGQQNITVSAVDGDKVTVDGNHPMAGKTLHFDVEVVDIREATAEEIEHGHVHGEGGHEH